MTMERLLATMILALVVTWATPSHAQRFTVGNVTSADLGNVTSATSGETTFRASSATGAVTKVSGGGKRVSGGSVRSRVTIQCNNRATCNTRNALVTIRPTGSTTGRAEALRNFTVSTAGASATIAVPPGAGNSISFQIGPVGRRSSKTFWVGYDIPIAGNDSGDATGNASSNFLVTVSRTNGRRPNSRVGTVDGNVLRAIAVATKSNLNFGGLVRPRSGVGTVSLNPATGNVSVTGAGTTRLSAPSPSAAMFSISGEGGQSVSVFVPLTLTMSGPSGDIVVTTNPDISGAQVLSGSAGSGGSLPLKVGGSFNISSATPTGAYTGTFAVTVQYN